MPKFNFLLQYFCRYFRRRQDILRKFGSRQDLPPPLQSTSSLQSEAKRKVAETSWVINTTTLPNYYTSDRQIMETSTSGQNSSVWGTSTSGQNSSGGAERPWFPPPLSLMIGGSPFHIVHGPQGSEPAHYETIDGEYSEISSNGYGCRTDHQLSGSCLWSTTTLGLYHDMSGTRHRHHDDDSYVPVVQLRFPHQQQHLQQLQQLQQQQVHDGVKISSNQDRRRRTEGRRNLSVISPLAAGSSVSEISTAQTPLPLAVSLGGQPWPLAGSKDGQAGRWPIGGLADACHSTPTDLRWSRAHQRQPKDSRALAAAQILRRQSTIGLFETEQRADPVTSL